MVPHSRAALRIDRLRALNVPTPVTVTVNDAGVPVEVMPSTGTCTGDNAPPTNSRWRGATSTTSGLPPACRSADPPTSYGRVADILEVWRIDDEWWRAPITRRYVDVVLDGGAHVVLFEDLQTGAWFVQQP